MEAGILEKVLTRRHGQPLIAIRDGMAAKVWNTNHPDDEAGLYIGMQWRGILGARFQSLRGIYGDSCGGYLIKNTLKAAILLPKKTYGIWNIDDLRTQPEVLHAVTRDPAIDYFMEEHNVLFYGVKRRELYVLDAETDQSDSLGPIESALDTLMDEWESIRKENRGG